MFFKENHCLRHNFHPGYQDHHLGANMKDVEGLISYSLSKIVLASFYLLCESYVAREVDRCYKSVMSRVFITHSRQGQYKWPLWSLGAHGWLGRGLSLSLQIYLWMHLSLNYILPQKYWSIWCQFWISVVFKKSNNSVALPF